MKARTCAEILVFLGLLAPIAGAQSTQPCTIKATTFDGFPAQEMSNQWVRLDFVPQLGGRLMQVTFNGHAYLFVNPKYAGKYITPEQAAGRWINYGGDKIWPLPEGNDDEQHWTGASTPLDDGAYAFKVIAKGERCTVRLDGPPDPPTGLQYSREISIGMDSPEIDFHAITKNSTGHTINWSVQSVSQYDLSDANAQDGWNHNFWTFTPVDPKSPYLLGYHVRDGLANDPSYHVKDGLFRLHWRYLEGEVWVDSDPQWLAVVNGVNQYTMVEKGTHFDNANYPGRASVIFYKNGPTVESNAQQMPIVTPLDRTETPFYMEAEMNSPMAVLEPGQAYTMDTRWFPCRMGPELKDVTDTGVIGKPLTATRNGAELELGGEFGVFFPGSLVAYLYDRGGNETGRVTVQTASPDDLIDLHRSVSAPKEVVRVSLHLVDTHNVDRGALGETFATDSHGAS
ncbi:MAG TPA: hypothetical protein VGT04_16470 [Acidobacteriaceae bacterium]|nr:hypothetical protein [Acidobacteriaceae bacterium]